MHERITFVSLFDSASMQKIESYVSKLRYPICRVPFGKNVDDRKKADTLPYHFTLFSWNIKKEKEVISFLQSLSFSSFEVLVDRVDVIVGNENSLELRFHIASNKQLYTLQNILFQKYGSHFFIPDNFCFHITIHVDKDHEKVLEMEKCLLQDFEPFLLRVNAFGLFEIWPAKKVYEIHSI